MIGATTSQSLDLILINKGDMVYGTSTIKVEIGLKIGSIIEYIPIGIYNIDDIEKTDYTIKITAFDNMIKFETPYFSTLGDTPTLQQVVNELSSKTGVQFIGNLPAYNVKKLEGFTCREILGYVASLCGGNAVITRDGKFTIVTPKDNSYSIGTANYIDYKREETKYKIGKVSCQVGEEVLSKGSLGTDSMELEFENPWINATILTDIYNKLNGFEYLGYSMKWQGDISLDVGDIVTITDKKGVVRKHPILSQKFTYTGGLTSEISAKGENKNKNEFSSSGPSAKKVERVVMELALINKALIDVAYIGDLTANNIKFDTASGGTLDLQSLLVKFVSGENGQYLNLTSSNVVIDNAVIKDAMIDTISASKINTGVLDTNLVTVQGPSGNLLIKDNTIQIKDANRTRVQIGKDASNDYNMYVWDSTGKLMFDATGLKADGIKSKIIRDDMISDTANINGSKINISSLITEVNKDTNTQVIKASKVAFDSTGQSLEVSFNSLKSNVDSKESRNLFSNTTSEYKDIGIGQWFTPVSQRKHCNYYGLVAGDKITFSLDIKSTSNKPLRARVDFYSEEAGDVGKTSYISTIVIPAGGEGKSYITAVIPNGKEYIQLMLSNGDTTITINTVEKYKCAKLEKGDNTNPVWTPAPEDIEEKIQANTTSITAVQGQVGILISDNTINKSNITTLQNNYTTIDATVNGLKTTVSSHTTSITNAQNTANNANTLADSKAKVFTSTPTTPYKTGDIWTGGPSGEIMKCKVARATGSYVAADWEKASKYTDDTKANAVEVNLNNLSGKVTTVETKQATLEQNIEGFKTTVSSTYSTKTELNTLNDTVTVVEQKVNTVEQNITAIAITTTISSAINAGTSSISTTQFVMDKNGLAIKNGALTIKNKAGTNVLTSDTNGNLTIAGTFINKNWNGVDAIKIQDTSIYFYDWERNGRELGIIYSSYLTDYPNVRGLSLAHHNEGYMTLGYKTSTGYSSYIVFDKYAKNPTYQSPIRVLESAVFNSAVNLQNRVFMPSNVYFGSNSESTTPIVFRGVNTNQLTVQLSVTNVNDGLKIQTNTGGILAYILAGNNYPAYFNTNTYINGNFAASGSKNSLQTTEHYGERLINAYETAEYYFGDIGSGIIKDGECLINIDEILQECINTNAEYHIFTQVYKGTITRIERYSNYFIAYGEEGTKFSWELKAKRRGYENVRLDIPEIGTIENIAVFTEEDYKINTSEDILLSEITFNLENLLMEG